jgi:hypothetical protein
MYVRQLQPHMEALTGWKADKMFAIEPRELVASVLVNGGWLLYQIRSDTELFMFVKKILLI